MITDTDTVNPTSDDQEMKSNDFDVQTQTQTQTHQISGYEKCREERIKENLERMQKLGIYDLSLKLKSIKPNGRRNNNKPINQKTPQHISPLPSSVPTRRSSRLQNTPSMSYSEVHLSKKGKDYQYDELLRDNSKPEIYTEEHEKLLGDCKTEWTLFVDGYGKDRKKIYDPVRGMTCHQCRQKTLGHRTRCIKCNLVQGQFCGDCLYMRYGENVLEAKQNPNWICPVCRGICNCSLCRQAKGWAPTGILYRKISNLGYKSVAHYLIQTRRSDPNSEKGVQPNVPAPAKRSLAFSKEEPEFEDNNATREEIKEKKLNETQSSDEEHRHDNEKADPVLDEAQNVVKESEVHSQLTKSECKDNNMNVEKVNAGVDESRIKVNDDSEVHLQLTNPKCKDYKMDDEVYNSTVTPVSRPGSRKKRCPVMEPVSGDSIAGRLRQRRKVQEKLEEKLDIVMMDFEMQTAQSLLTNPEHEDNNTGVEKADAEVNKDSEVCLQLTYPQCKDYKMDDEVHNSIVTPVSRPASRKKRCTVMEPVSGDSIAGRLRQRRKVQEKLDIVMMDNEMQTAQFLLTNPEHEGNNNTGAEKADAEVNKDSEVCLQLTYPGFEDKTDDEVNNSMLTPVTRPESKKKRHIVMEPATGGSIAGRLRQRRRELNEKPEVVTVDDEKQTSVSKQIIDIKSSSAQVESIAGRLRSRCKCV